ncbi:hypothetical protein DQ04_10841020, partial [Trypanosoma grayi]|uniref:hypothetical protein n=1 Tax=Trypanosoma grayi TaxID=71804 RepID=UPI0004F445F5
MDAASVANSSERQQSSWDDSNTTSGSRRVMFADEENSGTNNNRKGRNGSPPPQEVAAATNKGASEGTYEGADNAGNSRSSRHRRQRRRNPSKEVEEALVPDEDSEHDAKHRLHEQTMLLEVQEHTQRTRVVALQMEEEDQIVAALHAAE